MSKSVCLVVDDSICVSVSIRKSVCIRMRIGISKDISIDICIGESVQVSIENVKWPLDRQIISNKNVYSISNTALQDGDIKVNLYSGSMAIYVNFSC